MLQKGEIMTEEFLNKIRVESQKEIDLMEKYNEYADRRNELAEFEEIKKRFGLPYNGDMALPRKTETGIIMSVYDKYVCDINQEDTNEIYVYIGSYMPSDYSALEIDDGYPFEIEVNRDDPRAISRRYYNLEGIWGITLNVDESKNFEDTHTVIYVDDFYKLQSEFIVNAVKENQDVAVSKVLKKYNTINKR